MKIIEPSYEILTPINRDEMLQRIERAARTCYKSEDKITTGSASKIVSALVKSGHHAMLEHASITVKFITDRGVSHEIVRHRLASYAQESTRYVDYGSDKLENEITVIRPTFYKDRDLEMENWEEAMRAAERYYMTLRQMGSKPQEARSVLPNSLKTEIVVTMNLREWMHFFNLRAVGTTGAPHPQIRQIAGPCLAEFADNLPEIYGCIYQAYLDALEKEAKER